MNVRSIAAAAAVFAMMPSLAPHAMGAPAEDLRSDAAAGLSVGHEAQARIPVLVVTSGHRPISRYFGEILQAEGLNLFSTVDISRLTAETLERADLLVLAEVPVSAEQAELIGRWVESGGRLIAMRPDPDLAPLLGLEQEDRPVRDGYLLAEISSAAGRGIAQSTLQIHGEADRYRLTDGTVVAHLFAD